MQLCGSPEEESIVGDLKDNNIIVIPWTVGGCGGGAVEQSSGEYEVFNGTLVISWIYV